MNESKAQKYFNETAFKRGELIRSYYHLPSDYGAIDMHSHNFYELNVVIKGSGKHFVGERVFDISKGSVFIIPPFITHGYSFADNDFSVFHILFTDKFFDRYQSILNCVPGYNVFFDIEPYLRLKTGEPALIRSLDDDKFGELSEIFRLLDKYEKQADAPEQKKEFLVLYVITSICENIDYGGESNRESDRELFYIMKAAEYLQNNYDKKITITKLCETANMSRSAFLRNFKKYYDATPIGYLADFRVKQAKNMLVGTDKSVAAIAHDCGFFDSSHFIRTFKKTAGVSPFRFRSQSAENKLKSGDFKK